MKRTIRRVHEIIKERTNVLLWYSTVRQDKPRAFIGKEGIQLDATITVY